MQDDIDKMEYGPPHMYIFTTLSRNDRKCGELYDQNLLFSLIRISFG